MPEKSEIEFSFKSAGISGNPLNVTGFEGEEAISRPFAFKIDLFSGDPAIRRSTRHRRKPARRAGNDGTCYTTPFPQR